MTLLQLITEWCGDNNISLDKSQVQDLTDTIEDYYPRLPEYLDVIDLEAELLNSDCITLEMIQDCPEHLCLSFMENFLRKNNLDAREHTMLECIKRIRSYNED